MAAPVMMTTLSEFLALIGKPAKDQIHYPNYYGHTYRCACGFAHLFDANTSVLCEGYLKMILACPTDPQYLTSVRTRIYGIEQFGGLEGAFGVRLNGNSNQMTIDQYLNQIADGKL